MKKKMLLITLTMLCIAEVFGTEALNITSEVVSEAHAACKNLVEKDSCQIHDANRQWVSGVCTNKMGSSGELEVYCRADDTTQAKATNTVSSEPTESKKHKHKHRSE